MTLKMEIGVCEKPCNQCLFSDNKIVSEERKKEIIAELESSDGWFICHKSSINGGNMMCNGWYTRYKNEGILRLGDQFGLLVKKPVPNIDVDSGL